jgi:hypothetical protein
VDVVHVIPLICRLVVELSVRLAFHGTTEERRDIKLHRLKDTDGGSACYWLKRGENGPSTRLKVIGGQFVRKRGVKNPTFLFSGTQSIRTPKKRVRMVGGNEGTQSAIRLVLDCRQSPWFEPARQQSSWKLCGLS